MEHEDWLRHILEAIQRTNTLLDTPLQVANMRLATIADELSRLGRNTVIIIVLLTLVLWRVW